MHESSFCIDVVTWKLNIFIILQWDVWKISARLSSSWPVAYLGGAIEPWSPLAKKFFSTIGKIGKLGLVPLCASTSGQRKFGPPLWNPKYATNHDIVITSTISISIGLDEQWMGVCGIPWCDRANVDLSGFLDEKLALVKYFANDVSCEKLIGYPSFQTLYWHIPTWSVLNGRVFEPIDFS